MFTSKVLYFHFALCFLITLCFLVPSIFAEQITVVSYNTESGGANPTAIAAAMQQIGAHDIWGLSEVNSGWVPTLENAAEQVDGNQDYQAVLGTTAGSDRLLVLFKTSRFDLIDTMELHRINPMSAVRSPLVVHLRLKPSGPDFLFMVNHLYRGRENLRRLQARLLNRWGSDQSLPIIAVGDYNFDYSVGDGDAKDDWPRDEAFDLMTQDGVFSWIRPDQLIKTHDSNFNSVLDFIFLGGDSWEWKAKSTIIVRPGDFPDDSTTSDHRPVRAEIETP